MAEYTLSFTAQEIDNKLTNAILCTEQNLTEEQQAQARANLGIVDDNGDEIINITYSYDGNLNDDSKTWVYNNANHKAFVKVANLPQGELNLKGGSIEVIAPDNMWLNHSFEITDEILNQTVVVKGVPISSQVNGLTQIFYHHVDDQNPVSLIAICTKAGYYDVALNGWMEVLQFLEKGIYFLDFRGLGGEKFVDVLSCSYTKVSSENGEEVIIPTEYVGNEIEMFTRGLCIGDSITEGVFDYNGGSTVIRKYSYPSIFKRMTGIDVVNAGVAGMTSKSWYDISINSDTKYGKWVNNEWVWSVNPTVETGDIVSSSLDYSGFDFAIIHLGINDIGMPEEGLDFNGIISTFNTNINNIINKLKIENKGIKIFLCTIIPCYAYPESYEFQVLNEKIREIANLTNNVFLIDLNEYSDCISGSPYENQHLTALGYRKMTEEIISLINYTIKKNLNSFKSVQFIGTDYNI